MKRLFIPVSLAAAGIIAAAVHTGIGSMPLTPIGTVPGTASFHQFNEVFTGDWQQYGQTFTHLQASLFSRIFLLTLTLMPAVFFLHYLVIGAKQFSHQGQDVLYFPFVIRLIHWLTASSFTLLVLTGLMVIFGKLLGGGEIGMAGRAVHLAAAVVFTVSAFFMFLNWVKDMLPMPHDIGWILIMGGYLSKKKKPVPAGKFNAGQKAWFWLATAGGAVMAWTGYHLYAFKGVTDQLRLMAIIHNFLGVVLVAFFIIHLYMSLFAIKGSIRSMVTGYKPREEVEILHSRFKIPGSG